MPKQTPPPRGSLVTEPSDLWRAVWVQTYSEDHDAWTTRTDRWPYGLTLKPGVDPETFIKDTVVEALAEHGVRWKPDEIRLVEYIR